MSRAVDTGFSESDFDALIAFGEVDQEQENLELHRLSRRISAQYADVLAGFSRQAFGGAASASMVQQVTAAVDALRRLATSAGDVELAAMLERLSVLVPEHDVRGAHARRRFMRALREWVLAFAALLPPEDAARLHDMVVYDRRSLPLLDELAKLHGIGPKRLERLYCAGLFTVEAVGAADPHEVAQVTGLPRPLAHRVVEGAIRFADEERRRCVSELRRHASEIGHLLAARGGLPDMSSELVGEARAALEDLRAALARVESSHRSDDEVE